MRTINSLFMACAMIVLSTLIANAQEEKKGFGIVETETTVSRGSKPASQVTLFVTKPVSSDLNVTGWAQYTQGGYAQTYWGVSTKVGKVTIGGAAGVEHFGDRTSARVAASVSGDLAKRFSASAIAEYGGSGAWATGNVSFHATDKDTFALHAQRFLGIGGKYTRKINNRLSGVKYTVVLA